MGHTVFDPRILMYFLLFFVHSYLSHQDAFFLFVPQMIFWYSPIPTSYQFLSAANGKAFFQYRSEKKDISSRERMAIFRELTKTSGLNRFRSGINILFGLTIAIYISVMKTNQLWSKSFFSYMSSITSATMGAMEESLFCLWGNFDRLTNRQTYKSSDMRTYREVTPSIMEIVIICVLSSYIIILVGSALFDPQRDGKSWPAGINKLCFMKWYLGRKKVQFNQYVRSRTQLWTLESSLYAWACLKGVSP